MKSWVIAIAVVLVILGLKACRKDQLPDTYVATPYNFQVPEGFPPVVIPADNPMTVEGIELGRRLFYDKRLSGDNTLACAGCHFPQKAFADFTPTSVGIQGIFGTRNSMPLFNLAWAPYFFWDGRAATLEEQILLPVPDPIEMHQEWKDAVVKLYGDHLYPSMFTRAFGTPGIDSIRVAKAMAQFLRTIVSANSKYDRWRRGEAVLTPDEFAGFDMMLTEIGDCFHCHNPTNPLVTDFSLRNNGLQNPITDIGFEAVSGNINDRGKFKTPSLRNLAFSAPFMHDGRLATLDDVLIFYSFQVHAGPFTDPLMEQAPQGGVQLNAIQRNQIKAFLLTMTDSILLTNPAWQDPGY
jgi:cytochrome c peroxidase